MSFGGQTVDIVRRLPDNIHVDVHLMYIKAHGRILDLVDVIWIFHGRVVLCGQYGELIQSHMMNGTIVPAEITCRLIEKAMKKSGKEKFLIDGFPRNKDSLDGWNREMAEKAKILSLLFIDSSEKACIDRCLKRGAAGSGRSDDNIESIKKRFHTFYKETLPIINYFDEKGMVIKVDGNNDPDTVFQTISEKLQKYC